MQVLWQLPLLDFNQQVLTKLTEEFSNLLITVTIHTLGMTIETKIIKRSKTKALLHNNISFFLSFHSSIYCLSHFGK